MSNDKNNAAPNQKPAELAFDVEAMLAACVPGGSIVDPQVVADNIRAWAAERKLAELAEQQGVSLPPLPRMQEFTSLYGRVSAFGPDQMREYARAALAATGKQQVGEVQGDVPTEEMDEIHQIAFEIGGDDEGGYQFTAEDLEQFVRALAARQPGAQEVEFRDREADRQRFSDPKFNAYLDQAITENGEFTTWHQLTNTTDAYYGYQAGLHDGAPDPFGAQGIDLGQLSELAREMDSFRTKWKTASISEFNHYADRLLALIDQRDAAPGVDQ